MIPADGARRRLPDVIVLNGASSSGKTTLAAALQRQLDEPYLRFGVDTFVDALPPMAEGGIAVGDDGTVAVGETFARLERAWSAGLGAMARAGARLILDDVFLGGQRSQRRLASGLDGVRTFWVGVHCRLDVAVAREQSRRDRVPGMAATQAEQVHRGVHYDVEVDTSDLSPPACAHLVLDAIAGHTFPADR